jgi:ABC-type sulfate/molybdate transport systems ATPase subunit
MAEKMADPNDKKVLHTHDAEHATVISDDTSSLGKGDILQLEHTNPVLNAKMHLVNNAIGEFGCWKVVVGSSRIWHGMKG